VLLAVAYLFIMCGVYAAAWMLPEIAAANPGYVNDLLAVGSTPAAEPSKATCGTSLTASKRTRRPGPQPVQAHKAITG
jgi:hypothetical protein